jgi:hypothetical protein
VLLLRKGEREEKQTEEGEKGKRDGEGEKE